jgi:predicted DCC family thiol-disulfide oxidoreductase YuxK
MAEDAPVVLFDGTCNFCDGAVHFVIDHERGTRLRFAALQSEEGTALLDRATTPEHAKRLREGVTGDGDPDSVALVEDGKVYTHSTGALRIARYLRWPYRWLAAFWIVPRPIRDAVYRWFARHRYAWFGKTDACRVPTPEFRARFL